MASSPPHNSSAQGRSTAVDPNLPGSSRGGLSFATPDAQNESSFFNPSPTSTIASISSRMPSRTTPSMGAVPPLQKRIVIRADPTLVTCFDPTDKELYDLWAPR